MSDGRITELTSNGLRYGDVVPADVTWTVASPGFAGVSYRERLVLWLDPALHLHTVQTLEESIGQPRDIVRCGAPDAPAGILLTGSQATALTVRDGQLVSTSFELARDGSETLCMVADRLVQISYPPSDSLIPAFISSARLGEPLSTTTVPLGFFPQSPRRGVRRDGRAFFTNRGQTTGGASTRTVLVQAGQPLENATPAGRVPYLYYPLSELRDGSQLFAGLDPLGGTAWFRVEVAP